MSGAQPHDPMDALRDHMRQADERAVFRALPSQIAQALGFPARPTLELLVDAMFRGDAVLHWELFCPACHFITEEPDWLRHAKHDRTCPACGHHYNIRLDQEVYVTFSPHPALRTLGPEANDPEFQTALRAQYPPTTVHELMTVQSFRDWARNEPLTPGEHLQVRRMTVWFSDLTGSTALYARNGDPYAFGLVREHFGLIFEVINRFEGVVVKTMGDGIMAVFISNANAVEAALAAHQTLKAFNAQRDLPDDRGLMLKIGIHVGPSIMVTLDDRLDYFGTTVNVSARVSDLAQGTQTVLTEPVYSDPEVWAMLEGCDVESFDSDIRGLDQAVGLYRLR